MIRYEDYNAYLDWQSQEKMNSTGQASLADKLVDVIPKEVRNVLCVGAGDGYEVQKILDTGRASEGITLNLDAIKYKVPISKMDMHEMTFQDEVFDLVFCKDTFEHAFSHWQALREMKRVSKKYVLIALPEPDAWHEGQWHTIVLYPQQMRALAKKLGLRAVHEHDIGGITYYLFKK